MFYRVSGRATPKLARSTRLTALLALLALFGLFASILPVTNVSAVGSGDQTSGNRPFIEWYANEATGGIPRQTTIKAYANAGETIDIGSSSMGYFQGNVIIRAPNDPAGANTKSCVAQNGGNALYGRIETRVQEVAGPLPAVGGFVPCVVNATVTGVWEFDFISPNPNQPLGADPPALAMSAQWPTPGGDNAYTAAWHVSVRDAADAEIKGRVFANYLAMNMGSSDSLNRNLYLLTNDGYGYQVDMNGIQPYGFIFFGNAEGIRDAKGSPIYRSLQLTGPNIGPGSQTIPTDYSLHSPRLPDDPAQYDITHKIFFDLSGPDPTLPLTATMPGGSTWLLTKPEAPTAPSNPSFVGSEGTPGQAGTNPLGGYFEFDAPAGLTYNVVIDINHNNVYTETIDRVLIGRTEGTRTRVYWDGLDGNGNVVTDSTLPFNAQFKTFAGEVHFPFIDPENNPNGIRIQRTLPLTLTNSDPWTIYYNDAYTYRAGQNYDYSLCPEGGTPLPPAADVVAPLCYGTQTDPDYKALDGTSSQNGAHNWANTFGDRRVIDTWTYYPSEATVLNGAVRLVSADLSIIKSHSPATVVPGQAITYTLVVTNAGPSPAVDVLVNDNVPAEVTGVTWTCAVRTGTGTCNQTSGSGNLISTTVAISVGAIIDYTIVGTLSPLVTGTLTNNAEVFRSKDSTDPVPSNNTTTDTAPVLPVADLELNKTLVSPPPLVANSVITFQLNLRNRGPYPANNVQVTDQLPAGLTFVSATTPKGTYDSSNGIWSVGTMLRDEVATLTIAARWDGSTTTNTAQVTRSQDSSGQPMRDPDSTPNNNVPGEDDQSSVTVPPSRADLELVKSVTPTRLNVGQHAVFTLNLRNRGPDQATNVRVSDRLPLGLSFVRATPDQGSYNPVDAIWTVGTIAAGASTSMTLEVQVLQPGPFTNMAQVSASDQYDPDSTPNNDKPSEDDQSYASLTADQADLALGKGLSNPQPNLGETIVYTLTLRNDGPSNATGVAVTDKLPAGLTYVGNTPSQGTYDPVTGLWSVGTVPVGSRATLLLSATVQSAGRIENRAEVTASDQPDPDSTPNNGTPEEDDLATTALTPQIADLSLVKTASTTRPSHGGPVSFNLALTNNGPFPATSVRVSERLPTGLTYLSHTITRVTPVSTDSYSPATGVWLVGNLGIGETITLTLNARMDGVGPFTNTTEVISSDQYDPNSTPNNGDPKENDQSSVTVNSPIADLSVSKRATSPNPAADGTISYVVGVHNAGPEQATNVSVGERLPAGATFLSVNAGKGSYNSSTNSWTVGTLAVGESALMTLTVRLGATGPFVNSVEVTSSDQYDPDSTPNNNNPNEDDYATVTVPSGQIDLELTKTAVSLSNKLNEGALFRITVLNRGPDTATDVAVAEQLPPELRLISATPSQGSYDTNTNIWTVGQLAAGQSAQLLVAARILVVNTNQEIANTAQVIRAGQYDIDSTPNNNLDTEDDQATVRFTLVTPVMLSSFKITQESSGMRVEWQTGSEQNSQGFYLYYSPDGSREKMVQLNDVIIPAKGTPTSGASYSFTHANAPHDLIYTYWLVEVGTNALRKEYGPYKLAPYTVHLPLIMR